MAARLRATAPRVAPGHLPQPPARDREAADPWCARAGAAATAGARQRGQDEGARRRGRRPLQAASQSQPKPLRPPPPAGPADRQSQAPGAAARAEAGRGARAGRLAGAAATPARLRRDTGRLPRGFLASSPGARVARAGRGGAHGKEAGLGLRAPGALRAAAQCGARVAIVSILPAPHTHTRPNFESSLEL